MKKVGNFKYLGLPISSRESDANAIVVVAAFAIVNLPNNTQIVVGSSIFLLFLLFLLLPLLLLLLVLALLSLSIHLIQ